MMMLREQRRNAKLTLETRRIGIVRDVMKDIQNENGLRTYFELLSYEWENYDDFEKKYGSENNPESAARRFASWSSDNSMGALVRRGIIEVSDVYDAGGLGIIWTWAKFKPIIEEQRRRYNGLNYLSDFEFLANSLMDYIHRSDPNYRVPETFDKYILDK
jgi:hypothetical protein